MDCIQLKCGALIYSTRIIPHPKGKVLHGLKKSDPGYVDFGEAYFSTIEFGAIKGWKKHLRMSMNLLAPVGTIRFYLATDDGLSIEQVVLGEGNYQRLFIPPGVWVAFEGIGKSLNLMINIASIEHDPLESVAKVFHK
jgi:dTDP-4-dehydrorhamnose 3,5-epimerase